MKKTKQPMTFVDKIVILIAILMAAGIFSPFIELFQTNGQKWFGVLMIFIAVVLVGSYRDYQAKKKKERDYEAEIEKRIRTEKRIREKIERE